ncbi:MAG TPA: nucleotidyltransferase, partial [Vicingus sp.]|nr:nucleotidyltransferase [Vicingus sp.]
TVYTNQRVLEFVKNELKPDASLQNDNSIIIQPCYIGKNVNLRNAVVGPHVSIGDNVTINQSIVSNSIIQSNTTIEKANIKDSMIGNHVKIKQQQQELSVGDYTELN